MKTIFRHPGLVALTVLLLAGTSPLPAQDTRFFRLAGPVPATLTAVTPEGWVTWTNAPTNATFTVQTATVLGSATNWVDWVQMPTTNSATTNRLFDPTPPAGMALIPAGSFTMGATTNMGHESFSDEVPQHTVYVSAFYLDVNEVSSNQWRTVYSYATNRGYGFVNSGLAKAGNHPVQTVNWYDCVKWSNARSQQAGLVPVYYTDVGLTQVYTNGQPTTVYPKWVANGYRLPTEAEWEKAARRGL